MKLLEITASARTEGSASRLLSKAFTDAWQKTHPGATVLQRDLAQDPPDHPSQTVIQASYLQPADRTPDMVEAIAPSEALIDELIAADRVVIASPMYNYSIPSNLKAYIDNIVRMGRTFAMDQETYELKGLVTGKRALVIGASGGDYAPGSPTAAMDYFIPYLQTILEFIGITDVTVVRAPNQALPDPARSDATAKAEAELLERAADW